MTTPIARTGASGDVADAAEAASDPVVAAREADDAAMVGAGVGARLGVATSGDGDGEGLGVGFGVGSGVGSTVGLGVGFGVGFGVGLTVGFGVTSARTLKFEHNLIGAVSHTVCTPTVTLSSTRNVLLAVQPVSPVS